MRRQTAFWLLVVVGTAQGTLRGSSLRAAVVPKPVQLPPPRGGAREGRHAAGTLLALRGGARIGFLTPELLLYTNVVAGAGYVVSLIGLDPMLPDPTLKYWQLEQTPATKCILQFFALALMWVNTFMLYAYVFLGASARGLLKFQALGWISCLTLMTYQVRVCARWTPAPPRIARSPQLPTAAASPGLSAASNSLTALPPSSEQVTTYGFTAQMDTLGIQFTLFVLSAWLGYLP